MHARKPSYDNEHAPPARIDIGDKHVLTSDATMRAIYDRARQLGADRLPVLITGESGVGKEVVARALHQFSPWAAGPFIAVNCGSIPAALIETELFGHEKGAFSGAIGAKPGLIETAAGGTLLLDEIGELPLELQSRLLRVLDRGESRRIGAVHAHHVDVRILAATNRDLVAEVAANRFRSDLLFRLRGATLLVPPLRDRPLDISVLARDFLKAASTRLGRPFSISASAMFALLRYSWPGNVRELKHAIDLAALAATSTIEVEHLPEDVRIVPSAPIPQVARNVATGSGPVQIFQPLKEELVALERLRMVQALVATNWVVMYAARLVGMPRRSFIKKMKRYGIERPE